MTSMGAALKIAKVVTEEIVTIASPAYRPTIVLVSNGQPNDSCRFTMKALHFMMKRSELRLLNNDRVDR